jgi:hypothetical protein
MMLTISTAVVNVATILIIDDLTRLIDLVKDLVGETDFSFKVVPTETDSDSTIVKRKTRMGKAD